MFPLKTAFWVGLAFRVTKPFVRARCRLFPHMQSCWTLQQAVDLFAKASGLLFWGGFLCFWDKPLNTNRHRL